MELRRISVNNLFGILNYDIDLGNSETIIITGPNGYGKTMLLKIIDNILNKNIDFFFDLRFEEIKFELDTILLCIEKQKNKNVAVTVVDYVNDKKRQEVFTLNKNKELDVDYFDEIYNKLLICDNIDSDPILKSYNHEEILNYYKIKKIKLHKEKHHKSDFLDKSIPNAELTFIKAQRIENIKNEKSAIESQANFLLELIKRAAEESAQISQRLDSTFPARLFDSINENISSTSINDRLIGIQRKRELFMKFGIIKSEDTFIPRKFSNATLGKEYSTVLNLYISDALEKLSPYEELFEKINLFVNLLNEKMLAFKEIKISNEHGFYFQSDNGERISLSNLSSVKKNQIVIYFDLIFKAKQN
ncbi:ATPase, partial [Salmonella enterica subsp. enterica serovar Typhimurium]|uniref:AAA family ATPase n=1 Tax=Salmonella enterica TaxID=28901 RepID=UPI000C01FDDA